MKKMLVATVAAAVLAFAVQAKTTTWTGGKTGSIADATWSNGAPQPGDTVRFTSEVTALTGDLWDLGSAGLTISNSATVTWQVPFKGTGELKKYGTSELVLNYENTAKTDTKALDDFTGNIRLYEGVFSAQSRYNKYPFGKGGTIYINRLTDTRPGVRNNSFDGSIPNNIVINGSMPGSATAFAVCCNQKNTFSGTITGNDDISLGEGYRPGTFSGAISVPYGKNVYVTITTTKAGEEGDPAKWTTMKLTGRVSGSVIRQDYDNKPAIEGFLSLENQQGRPSDKLRLEVGTNTLESSAVWNGRLVEVASTKGRAVGLVLKSANNLKEFATLKISNSDAGNRLATVDIPNGVTATVNELWVEGVKKSAGTYTAASLPGYITGGGSLKVKGLAYNVWIGADNTKKWSDGANWTLGHSPADGEYAYFPEMVSPAGSNAVETVDYGNAKLQIIAYGTFYCQTKFKGTGAISKAGTGKLVLVNDQPDLAAPIALNNGILESACRDATKPFGTGKITIKRNSDTRPILYASAWNQTVPNEIAVDGAIPGNLNGNDSVEGAIYFSQKSAFTGSITGNDDLSIKHNYRELTVSGPVSVPSGKKVYLLTNFADSRTKIDFTGSVKGDVVRAGVSKGLMYFAGEQGRAGDTFTFEAAGTNGYAATATWLGSKMIVRRPADANYKGDDTVLELNGSANLLPTATLEVDSRNAPGAGRARVNVASGVTVKVGSFIVDGETKPAGVYDRSNCDCIVGAGAIEVPKPTNEWVGEQLASWNETTSWSLGEVPVAGDTVRFPDSVVTVGVEKVTYDAGTITIVNSKKLVIMAEIAGGVKVIKDGAGELAFAEKCTFTGGLQVRDGDIAGLGSANNQQNIAGEGTVELVAKTTESPYYFFNRWGAIYTNDFAVSGEITGSAHGALYNSNKTEVRGNITGDGNFRINNGYANLIITGDVTLPKGKLLTLNNTADSSAQPFDWNQNPITIFRGAVNASIRKIGPGHIVLGGTQTREDDAITLNHGTIVMTNGCYWAGTNIVVNKSADSYKPVLSLSDAGNLNPAATIRLTGDTAKLNLCNAKPVRVAALVIDGVAQPNGLYDAAKLPASITGTGAILVGEPVKRGIILYLK